MCENLPCNHPRDTSQITSIWNNISQCVSHSEWEVCESKVPGFLHSDVGKAGCFMISFQWFPESARRSIRWCKYFCLYKCFNIFACVWSHPKNSCRVYMYIFIQLDRDSYELVIILPSSTLTAVNTGDCYWTLFVSHRRRTPGPPRVRYPYGHANDVCWERKR